MTAFYGTFMFIRNLKRSRLTITALNSMAVMQMGDRHTTAQLPAETEEHEVKLRHQHAGPIRQHSNRCCRWCCDFGLRIPVLSHGLVMKRSRDVCRRITTQGSGSAKMLPSGNSRSNERSPFVFPRRISYWASARPENLPGPISTAGQRRTREFLRV